MAKEIKTGGRVVVEREVNVFIEEILQSTNVQTVAYIETTELS